MAGLITICLFLLAALALTYGAAHLLRAQTFKITMSFVRLVSLSIEIRGASSRQARQGKSERAEVDH